MEVKSARVGECEHHLEIGTPHFSRSPVFSKIGVLVSLPEGRYQGHLDYEFVVSDQNPKGLEFRIVLNDVVVLWQHPDPGDFDCCVPPGSDVVLEFRSAFDGVATVQRAALSMKKMSRRSGGRRKKGS